MPSAAEVVLDVRGLRTAFATPRGELTAVDDVSLSLPRGKTLGIVGESGSGKSALVRSIMGLPQRGLAGMSGEVLFEGTDLRTLSSRQLRRLWGDRIAMVFQDPMTALNPVVRIGRQLTESLRLHRGMNRSQARAAARELLERVGIPEPGRRLDEYAHQLSGGMRQRVIVAMAIACGPSLILADEPTTALDVTVQAQILDLLARLQRDSDMGLVLVTHDLGVVANRADEVAVMYAGQVVEQAPTAQLFADVQMHYTAALLHAVPRLANPSHTRLNALPGRPPDLAHPPAGCRFAARCPQVQDRCRAEAPPLVEQSPGHRVRCWFPLRGTISSAGANAPAGAGAAKAGAA